MTTPTPGPWFQPADKIFGPILGDGTHNPDPNIGWTDFQVNTATAPGRYNVFGSFADSQDVTDYTAETAAPDWTAEWDAATAGAGSGPVSVSGMTTVPTITATMAVNIQEVHTDPPPRTVSVEMAAEAEAMLCTLRANPTAVFVFTDTPPPNTVGYEIDPDDLGDVLEAWVALAQWRQFGPASIMMGLAASGDVTLNVGSSLYHLNHWPSPSTGLGSVTGAGSGSTTTAPHSIAGPFPLSTGLLTPAGSPVGRFHVAPLLVTLSCVSGSTLETVSALDDFWAYWQANDVDDGSHFDASGVDDFVVCAPVLCYRFRPPRVRWLFTGTPPLRQRQVGTGIHSAGPRLRQGQTAPDPPLRQRQNRIYN